METFAIKRPPIIHCKIDNLDDQEFYIKDFVEKLEGKHLDYFYNNLKTLRVKITDKLKLNFAGAEYDIYANIINCPHSEIRRNIMHELFHVATRVKNGELIHTGFMIIYTDKRGIGIGLNEGYTCLMDDRYFPDYDINKLKDKNVIYKMTKYICHYLDLLVGKDYMEHLYMHADLAGLYDILSDYSNDVRAYNFLKDLDRLYLEADIKKIPNIPKVFEIFDNIKFFLAECFVTRFRYQLRDGELTQEEFDQVNTIVNHLLDDTINYFKIIRSKKYSKYRYMIDEIVDQKISRV